MNTKNAKKEKPENQTIDVKSWDVDKVRCISTKNGDMVVFSLIINDVTIMNCRVATTRDGHDFVSYPQYKGKDDKYYSYVYAPLPNDVNDSIMERIQSILDGEE